MEHYDFPKWSKLDIRIMSDDDLEKERKALTEYASVVDSTAQQAVPFLMRIQAEINRRERESDRKQNQNLSQRILKIAIATLMAAIL